MLKKNLDGSNYKARILERPTQSSDTKSKTFGDVIFILESSNSLDESAVDYRKLSGQKREDNYYRIRIGNWRIGVELFHPSIV